MKQLMVSGEDAKFSAELFDEFEQTHANIFRSKLDVLYAALTRAAPTGADGVRATGTMISVGGGTASYESALRDEYGVMVDRIIEPSEELAVVARARGFLVDSLVIEDATILESSTDTIFYNGSAFGFIDDESLSEVFVKHYRQLRDSGRLVLLDVPPTSALGIAVQSSADQVDNSVITRALESSWYHQGAVMKPYWRSTPWYINRLQEAGFTYKWCLQSLRSHLEYQDGSVEEPVPGYMQGSYVALVVEK
ncbi:MAG: hypothetical protein LKF41_07345 [Bifidobacterium sp.]|jgi:hypothetical protein|nr:hypothetical protein [Bifidobacterium sp.]